MSADAAGSGLRMLANETFHIAVLPGDGIGPEVMAPALAVLEKVAASTPRLKFRFTEAGNPGGSLEATRRSFNKDFLLALAADFKKHGAAAIEKVRKQQPAAYMKICAAGASRDEGRAQRGRQGDERRGDRAGHRAHPDHARGASRRDGESD